jgi:hypothetical protein
MQDINLMLESVLSGDMIESKEIVESILADKVSKKLQECKKEVYSNNLRENNIAKILTPKYSKPTLKKHPDKVMNNILSTHETGLKSEEFTLDENKLADVMDTVRYHIGPVSKGSVITKALKDKTTKEISKEHGLPNKHAAKFVNDYCSSC